MYKNANIKPWTVISVFLLGIASAVLAGQTVFIDVFYTDGGASEISGTLDANTTLDAASSPWYVTDNVIVPPNITLSIEPGVTVFIASGKGITIKGRLIAEGTEQELIHFTRYPAATDKWYSLQFVDTTDDNRITYALLEHGRTNDGMIGLKNSKLLLDHVTLTNTDLKRIRTVSSSLVVRNSVFTDMFAPGEPPTTNNRSEHIWGSGIPPGGHFIIENNVFGTTTGHNDAIDFDSPRRPDTSAKVLNNIFMGGGDDALDVEADMHIEGNIFMNYSRDQYNTAVGESNVISAGGSGPEQERDYSVVRNIFSNIHHVAQVKDEAFMTFVNNTVVGVSKPAIYFDWIGRRPGRGAYVDGCIFSNTALIFDSIIESTELAVHHSIIPSEWHYLGQGNIDTDPCFAEPGYWVDKNDPNIVVEPNDPNALWIEGDYHLKSQAGRWDSNSQSWVKDDVTSPAIDAGDMASPIGDEPFPNGGIINMGAYGGTNEASKSYFGQPLCETPVAGDINGDCKVNHRDFAIIAAHWLREQ